MTLISGPQTRFAGGYLNVNKPTDWTSTDVVRKLKGITKVKKIGHGGTLDPIASGVLPVCLGAATRFAESILLGTKEYRMTVTLGAATDTYDSTGEVVKEADCSGITEDDVRGALAQFTGEYGQSPPMYSAVKHEGRRLYTLARQGVEVERPPRRVVVHSLDLVRWAPSEFDLQIHCGHGFYARTLANDLGAVLCGAGHLSALVRTRAGAFSIDDSVTVEQIERRAHTGDWRELAHPIDHTLGHLRAVVLDPLRQEMVQHGRAILAADLGGSVTGFKQDEQIRAYSNGGELIAILGYQEQPACWQPDKVLAAF